MLTFAIETPARKVHVNGAERGFMRLSGAALRSGGLSRWRISDTEDVLSFVVALFSLLPISVPHLSFFSEHKIMTSSVFKTLLDSILPKTLKVFEIQYRRRDETSDAKLKHGSVADCRGCHGNTSFRVIWILGVFPGKFPPKKEKKRLDLDLSMQESTCLSECSGTIVSAVTWLIYYRQQPKQHR